MGLLGTRIVRASHSKKIQSTMDHKKLIMGCAISLVCHKIFGPPKWPPQIWFDNPWLKLRAGLGLRLRIRAKA